jgi:UPF0755 protein
MASGRRKKLMALTRLLSSVLIASTVLVLALGSLFSYFQFKVHQAFQGYQVEAKVLVIPRGHHVSQVAELLRANGIIQSSRTFLWYLRVWFPGFSPKAGEYRFSAPLNVIQVAQKLHAGEIHYHRVTIPEGLTMIEIVDRLVAQGFGQRELFLRIVQNPAPISDLDPDATNLEGYLFPETYLLTRGAGEKEIILSMVAGFRKLWTSERRTRAAEIGLSVREVVSLASLIEKETGAEPERKLVSAVFHNRLQKHMKLACDPTVIYAVKLVKEYDGVIHLSDLNLDSPYNTYLYPGLPPGPIANPGLASMDAALYPAEVNYLYFVSRNDGTHIFSEHYRDHKRAVQAYQR